ncbi:MAG: hypothetical protein LBL72_06155 [Candidatus Accumulibacter sp.]|jgi:hypothetical protein|nr:hypothetical protein [Accumulibacter sp.]
MRSIRAFLSVVLFLLLQAACFAHTLSHTHAADAPSPDVCAVCAAVQNFDGAPTSQPDTPVFEPVFRLVTHFETPSFVDASRLPRLARAPPAV